MLFEVENIKCNGCANSIRTKLLQIHSVDEVSVDVVNGQVRIHSEHFSESLRDTIKEKLTRMGYPEKNSVEGLKSMKAKATSYISCAIGKINEQH